MESNTKTGIEEISEERKRQIESEGWTSDHDDQHEPGELSQAAACYALGDNDVFVLKADGGEKPMIFDPWPWFEEYNRYSDSSSGQIKVWDKREEHSRFKRLKIAGALIAAELDKMIRLDKK